MLRRGPEITQQIFTDFTGLFAAQGCSYKRHCYRIDNNQLRQFVFFSYNFPYILPAAS